jgi:hypothetical protein
MEIDKRKIHSAQALMYSWNMLSRYNAARLACVVLGLNEVEREILFNASVR